MKKKQRDNEEVLGATQAEMENKVKKEICVSKIAPEKIAAADAVTCEF